jgi:hypothetical protein
MYVAESKKAAWGRLMPLLLPSPGVVEGLLGTPALKHGVRTGTIREWTRSKKNQSIIARRIINYKGSDKKGNSSLSGAAHV